MSPKVRTPEQTGRVVGLRRDGVRSSGHRAANVAPLSRHSTRAPPLARIPALASPSTGLIPYLERLQGQQADRATAPCLTGEPHTANAQPDQGRHHFSSSVSTTRDAKASFFFSMLKNFISTIFGARMAASKSLVRYLLPHGRRVVSNADDAGRSTNGENVRQEAADQACPHVGRSVTWRSRSKSHRTALRPGGPRSPWSRTDAPTRHSRRHTRHCWTWRD